MRSKKSSGGGSRRPAFISEAGKQAPPIALDQCDAKLDPVKVFLKRKRKDNSTYNVVIEKGERCPNEAIASKRENGRTVKRCAGHIGGY